MAYIDNLKDKNNNIIYPRTTTSAIQDIASSKTLETVLGETSAELLSLREAINQNSLKEGILTNLIPNGNFNTPITTDKTTVGGVRAFRGYSIEMFEGSLAIMGYFKFDTGGDFGSIIFESVPSHVYYITSKVHGKTNYEETSADGRTKSTVLATRNNLTWGRLSTYYTAVNNSTTIAITGEVEVKKDSHFKEFIVIDLTSFFGADIPSVSVLDDWVSLNEWFGSSIPVKYENQVLTTSSGSSGPAVEVVDNLTTADPTKALSANQGKVLKDYIDSRAENPVSPNGTYENATVSASGLMSAGDKEKIDNIESEANKYVHPTTDGNLHLPIIGPEEVGKILKAGSSPGGALWVEHVDTVTTINGKTGAITKADVVALGLPAQDTNTTYIDASTTTSGLMSGADKTKLNGVSIGANTVLNHSNNGSISINGSEQVVYTHPSGTNPHSTTKADIGLSNVDNTPDFNKPVSTPQQAALNLKVDKTQVLTNVPVGAIFTDTKYSNVTTGANGLMSNIDKVKLDGIEVNANNYIHPTTDGNLHIPVIRPEDGGKVLRAGEIQGSAYWAKDQNDITTINGKTGVIVKADLVALGLPAQDTTYTAGSNVTITGNVISATGSGGGAVDSVNGKTGAVTIGSEDIAFQNTVLEGDMTTVKEAISFIEVAIGIIDLNKLPLSGGTLGSYTEKLTATTGVIDLSQGNVFSCNATNNTIFSITNAEPGVAHSFTLFISQGTSVRTLTFPASVKWQNGTVPVLVNREKTYLLTFTTIDGGATFYGVFGGEF